MKWLLSLDCHRLLLIILQVHNCTQLIRQVAGNHGQVTTLLMACTNRPRPKLPPGVHWSMGLITAMTDPEQLFEQDDLTVTIYDGFPKAKYHYLIVPKEDIDSVAALRKKHLPLLMHMDKKANDLVLRFKADDPDAVFRCGYHSVPSMKRLHLHVVSQDFNSFRMRKQHHWNTFNTEYFMDSELVVATIEDNGHIDVQEEFYELLLQLQMRCNYCSILCSSMDELKSHIRKHDADTVEWRLKALQHYAK